MTDLPGSAGLKEDSASALKDRGEGGDRGEGDDGDRGGSGGSGRNGGGGIKTKRRQCTNACSVCIKAKAACSDERPCAR